MMNEKTALSILAGTGCLHAIWCVFPGVIDCLAFTLVLVLGFTMEVTVEIIEKSFVGIMRGTRTRTRVLSVSHDDMTCPAALEKQSESIAKIAANLVAEANCIIKSIDELSETAERHRRSKESQEFSRSRSCPPPERKKGLKHVRFRTQVDVREIDFVPTEQDKAKLYYSDAEIDWMCAQL